MVLYTKYQSSGPCGFRQKDLFNWTSIFWSHDLIMQTIRSTLTILVKDHFFEVWSISSEQFQRRCFNEIVDGQRITDDKIQWTKASHKSSPWVFFVSKTYKTEKGQHELFNVHRNSFQKKVIHWSITLCISVATIIKEIP